MGTIAKVLIFLLVGFMALTLFVPSVRQILTRTFSNSETIVLPSEVASVAPEVQEQEYDLVTLLGYDAIPAILDPEFVEASEANEWMSPNEQVLGISINGEHRAYSIPMLSRHEIVNDTVGGVPVAVTW